MNEKAMRIQAVINTLEMLTMPVTYDNANRMLGIYKALAEVRDALNNMKEAEDDAGDSDAE